LVDLSHSHPRDFADASVEGDLRVERLPSDPDTPADFGCVTPQAATFDSVAIGNVDSGHTWAPSTADVFDDQFLG
jgi:hypothetical protein